MVKKRELTDLGALVILVVACAYWIAGFAVSLNLEIPNSNHDGHHHFGKVTWIAFICWWIPFVITTLIYAVRHWWTQGHPGLWETKVEPAEDIRKHYKAKRKR